MISQEFTSDNVKVLVHENGIIISHEVPSEFGLTMAVNLNISEARGFLEIMEMVFATLGVHERRHQQQVIISPFQVPDFPPED